MSAPELTPEQRAKVEAFGFQYPPLPSEILERQAIRADAKADA